MCRNPSHFHRFSPTCSARGTLEITELDFFFFFAPQITDFIPVALQCALIRLNLYVWRVSADLRVSTFISGPKHTTLFVRADATFKNATDRPLENLNQPINQPVYRQLCACNVCYEGLFGTQRLYVHL